MKCKFIKTNEQKCNANHTKGSKYCFRHDPKNKTTALEVSRKGGQNRTLKGNFGKEINLNTADDVKVFLSQVINAVWTGEVPVKVGCSMGFLTRCWLDAHQVSKIEGKLSSLEERLKSSNL